jgi:two-component sensor histidine kinase
VTLSKNHEGFTSSYFVKRIGCVIVTHEQAYGWGLVLFFRPALRPPLGWATKALRPAANLGPVTSLTEGNFEVNLRQLRTWPMPPKLETGRSLAIGAGILFAAVLLRLVLDHVVPGRLAFTTYFPATVLAAYLTGAPGGLVVLAGGLMGSLFTWFGTIAEPDLAIAVVGNGVFGVTGAVVVLALAALREAIFELAKQDERARIINRELVHRNRNQYAVMAALSTQTMRRVGISGDVADAVTDRVVAMGEALDLVSLDPQQDIALGQLIERVVVSMAPEPSRMVIGGPMVGVRAGLVSDLALVLHELGTNALKYGAWSNDCGRVTVSWQPTDQGVSIVWKEQGGPPTAPPDAKVSGLGSVLIENAIAGGTAERRFELTGLTVALHVPL